MAFIIARMRGMVRGIKSGSPAPSPALNQPEARPNSESAGYAGDLSGVAGEKDRSDRVFAKGWGKHTPHHPHPPRFHNCAIAGGAPASAAATDPELLVAQLANAESDRLDALETAESAADDRDGYRRELARVRGQVRELEGQLRAEKHEHAEVRERTRELLRERVGLTEMLVKVDDALSAAGYTAFSLKDQSEARRIASMAADLSNAREQLARTKRRPRAGLSVGPNRTAYAVIAGVLFAATFVTDNPLSRIAFAVSAFLLMVAFVLSPRSPR